MKYRGKQPSAVDKQVNVYNFTLGKPELLILMDILSEAYRKTPRSLFTQPFTSRVDAMKTEIAKTFKTEGIPYPVSRANYKSEPGEIF